MKDLQLIPVKETLEENSEFVNNPSCQDTIHVTVDYYKRIGFHPPWICYYVIDNGEIMGSAGIKGKPVNGTIEIAYGTVEKHRHKGIGTYICKLLVDLALAADAGIRITARTLPEHNHSTRILMKNNFVLIGPVSDPEDGEVWEWVYVNVK